jgi:hypothetical protein
VSGSGVRLLRSHREDHRDFKSRSLGESRIRRTMEGIEDCSVISLASFTNGLGCRDVKNDGSSSV